MNSVVCASSIEPIVVDVATAMKLSNIGRTQLYVLLNSNAIASRKVGKRRLVNLASLRAFLTNDVSQESNWRSL